MKFKLKVALTVLLSLLVVVVVFFAINSRTSVKQSTEALEKLQDSAKLSRKIFADNKAVAEKMKKDIIYYGITGKYTPELESLREYTDIDASNPDDGTTDTESSNKTQSTKTESALSSDSQVTDTGLSNNTPTIKEKGEEEFFRAAPDEIPEANKSTTDVSAYMESANIVEEDYYVVIGSDKLKQFIVINGSDGSTLKITATWKGGRLYEASAVAN